MILLAIKFENTTDLRSKHYRFTVKTLQIYGQNTTDLRSVSPV